jgi:hypothetical protein
VEAGREVAARSRLRAFAPRRGGGRRALVAALLSLAAGTAAAGEVTGVVRLAGTPPPAAPPIRVTHDAEACGATVPDERLVVGAAGGVANAVVVVRGVPVPSQPPPAAPLLLDNAGCRFAPRVAVARRGQPVRVRNQDLVLHNAHPVLVAEPEVTIANVALGIQGQTADLTRRLRERLPPGGEALVRFGCDVHPWMRGWLLVADHPWAAVTDADGRFTVPAVPAGSWTLAVWHETLGRSEVRVAVPADGTADARLTLPQP